MNAYTSPYGSITSPTKDPRTAEAALLARITRRLCEADRSRADDFATFATALEDNRRFWAAAIADLASDGNGLPDDLRARLISIAGFVLRHTSQVLGKGATVDALVEINRAVIGGLSAESIAA